MIEPALPGAWPEPATSPSARADAGGRRGGRPLEGLASAAVAALRALDVRLAAACDAVQILHGRESRRDLFRGLHITPDDASRALGRTPAVPLFGPSSPGEPLVPPEVWAGTRFERMAERFGLTSFDLDLLLVALAPEIDGRYERLFAFVQDDVRQCRPTVELALNLLCATVPEKLERLSRLGSDGPLHRAGLVEIRAPAADPGASRLGHELAVDPVVVRHLLGDDSLDERLARCCRFARSARAEPARLVHRAGAEDLVRYVRAPDPAEALEVAAAGAGPQGVLLLDVRAALSCATSWGSWSVRCSAPRPSRNALSCSTARTSCSARTVGRSSASSSSSWQVIRARSSSGSRPWEPAVDVGPAVISTALERPGPELRRRAWLEHLGEACASVRSVEVAEVASRFRLTGAQIARAARLALHLGSRHGRLHPGRDELFEGARAQACAAFEGLATRLEAGGTFEDLVLPPDALAQLRELATRVVHRETVLGEWGFGRHRSSGKGTAVLFAGPPGTGKTFAAGVLARELGLDLHRVDLSRVVSKYIGETEKHLARLFDRAEGTSVILLFDEAEALFGKRSQVKDAHDRYANQELAYLLQRIEEFEGLSILTTNMPGSMDEAFRRRLAATVYFPMPDEAARRRLWAGAWPAGAPLAADVDHDLLAAGLRIPGGVIVHAALAAAYLAAGEGAPISLRHVLHAVRRELDALGAPMPALAAPAAGEGR